MMSVILMGNSSDDGGEEQVTNYNSRGVEKQLQHEETTVAVERDKACLAEQLLTAAKQCHKRFNGKTELATESEQCVLRLCSAFERIFGHGLLARPSAPGAGGSGELATALCRHVSELVGLGSGGGTASTMQQQGISFWSCVREQLTWHERERFSVLRKVQTDQGRGRAWLRAALNERSLENHLQAILGCNPVTLQLFYQPWAFILDQDRSSILPNVAAGLTTILFATQVDNEELDTVDPDQQQQHQLLLSLQNSSLSAAAELIINPEITVPQVKLRKKVLTHVISFDDEASAAAADTAETSSLEENIESLQHWQLAAPLYAAKEMTQERLLTPLLAANQRQVMMGSLMPLSPIDADLNLPSQSYCLGLDGATEAAVEATEPLCSAVAAVDEQQQNTLSNVEALKLRLLALNAIEQSREEAIASKLQLARFQRQHKNYIDKHELQIQTLNRENELLRQQLRKYVTAVQLLKKDSLLGCQQQHKESTEQYQIKLIQVAEMHAELMEFNARLTVQLNNKDKFLKLLQAELECLRGPISEKNKAPLLIHIWIPSAFLTGQSSDIHHVYQIYIRIRDAEWNIYRRYAQFYALYRELKKQDSIITSFEFPPKKTIGNKDARFVEDRRRKLQQWLRLIVNRLSHCSEAFSSNPTKQTLITLLPFFGDVAQNNLDSRRNHSYTCSTSSSSSSSSSPQYMNL